MKDFANRDWGIILLSLFLILYGVTILVGLAIPTWVAAVLAIVAGAFLLIGI